MNFNPNNLIIQTKIFGLKIEKNLGVPYLFFFNFWPKIFYLIFWAIMIEIHPRILKKN